MATAELIAKPARVNIRTLPVLAKRQIDSASLPENYKAAKLALQECDRVDEVKGIADKHSAIAHYAKQIKDNSLLFYAERIHLRAIHRIGELMKDIPTAKERKAFADQFGMSGYAAERAHTIGHLPTSDLSTLVDASPPASKSTLQCAAAQYMHPKRPYSQSQPYDRDESPYARIDTALDDARTALITESPECCERRHELPDAIRWARMLKEDEAEFVRFKVRRLIEWLDDFDRGMPETKSRGKEDSRG
jgi:hypothetical protein